MLTKRDKRDIERVGSLIIDELEHFHEHFEPQVFESTSITTHNLNTFVGPAHRVGPVHTPTEAAILNQQQERLRDEPFVAYIKAIETKRRKNDDAEVGSEEVIYLINRCGSAGIDPKTTNARFIPNATFLGSVAEEDIGVIERKFTSPQPNVYLEIEILEKNLFRYDKEHRDGLENNFEFDRGTYWIDSLRGQLQTGERNPVESWELFSDAFGLRDRPNLDKIQGSVSRIKLDSQLVISGFPGTGKTTTMIRRLAFKSNPSHITETDAAFTSNIDSWIAFTPNETLKSYLKEAMTREGLLAPNSKLRTWEAQRNQLIRETLKIVDIASNKAFIISPKLTAGWTNADLWTIYEAFQKYLDSVSDPTALARNLRRIPAHFRQFRKNYAKSDGDKLFGAYSKENLEQCISNNEADILILTMLKLANDYFTSEPLTLSSNTNNDLLENIKSIHRRQVAIDEATDFSIVELGCMINIANPSIRSVTLCGDPMQRLTNRGIPDWDELNKLSFNFERKDFSRDYRLTAKLGKIAAILSNRENLSNTKPDGSPNALKFHSSNREVLYSWIGDRIIEIYKKNKGKLPTTAIITPSEDDIGSVFDALSPMFEARAIGVENCSLGKSDLEDSNIRIFSSKYIKGLEFDAVFFIDIDQFPDQDLIDKFLYVGLTRSRAFLAVTYSEKFPDRINHVEEFFEYGDWASLLKE